MRCSGAICLLISCFFLLGGVPILRGQSPPTEPPITLTDDHPIVIEHLIRFHSALNADIAQRNVLDPQRSGARQRAMRDLFGISDVGLATLNNVLSNAKAELDQIEVEQHQYVATLTQSKGVASDAKMQSFFDSKGGSARRARANLQAQLSAEDWKALRRFIASEIMGKLKIGRLFNAGTK